MKVKDIVVERGIAMSTSDLDQVRNAAIRVGFEAEFVYPYEDAELDGDPVVLTKKDVSKSFIHTLQRAGVQRSELPQIARKIANKTIYVPFRMPKDIAPGGVLSYVEEMYQQLDFQDQSTMIEIVFDALGFYLDGDWDSGVATGRAGPEAVEQAAAVFRKSVPQPVDATSEYHGAKKDFTAYTIEPDGSIEGALGNEEGLEIVSPVFDTPGAALDAIKQTFDFLAANATTNASTGLHINIDMPGRDLDLLKLAVTSGADYVNALFGREGNQYAKSIVQHISTEIKNMRRYSKYKQLSTQQMFKIILEQEYSNILASAERNSNVNMSEFNKKQYIEFRAAGGTDYHTRYEDVEQTVLRFARAIMIAGDPSAYKREFLSKLYTIVERALEQQEKPSALQSKILANRAKKIDPAHKEHVYYDLDLENTTSEVVPFMTAARSIMKGTVDANTKKLAEKGIDNLIKLVVDPRYAKKGIEWSEQYYDEAESPAEFYPLFQQSMQMFVHYFGPLKVPNAALLQKQEPTLYNIIAKYNK